MAYTKAELKIISNKKTEHKEFWMDYLNGEWIKSSIPTDYKLTSKNSSNINSKLEDTLYEKLQMMSHGNEQALKVILCTSMFVLIHKYTASEDIILGYLREQDTELNPLLQEFTPIRSYVTSKKSFKEVLNETKVSYMNALKYSNYPMQILLEELKLNAKGEDVFTDIYVKFKNNNLHHEEHCNNSRIIFEFIINENLIELTVHYNTGFYDIKTMERFMNCYIAVLNELLNDIQQTIDKVDLLLEADLESIKTFNKTSTPFRNNIRLIDIFEEQVNKTPDKQAVVGDGFSLTYKELNEKSNQLALVLRNKGVTNDKIVGIIVERSAEMMIGIMAILKAGGAYMPIPPNYPNARIEYILKDSKCEMLLVQAKFLEHMQYDKPTIILEKSNLYSGSSNNMEIHGGSHDLAYVIYTSGSTGNPKGVMIENQAVINRVQWMQKTYPITSKDVILQKTTFAFDVSVWELFWWMFDGASVCMLSPEGEKDPDVIINYINKYHVTTMHFVPSMLNVFLDYVKVMKREKDLGSLCNVFASGEALTVDHVNKFNGLLRAEHGIKLINLYGPTEATVDVSYFNCFSEETYNKIPIGKPIDNIRLYIVNDQLKQQPIGVPGELCIAGIGLARGYLHNAELTAEKFVLNPFEGEERIYRTGDLARLNNDGQIEYLGRIDHQVKIRGLRIELGEIEGKLRQHKDISDATVIVREDQLNQQYLCAYIIEKKPVTDEILVSYLLEYLPEYMIPNKIVRIISFPITANGKLDRKALPLPKHQNQENGYVEPRNEKEKIIAQIWCEALGLEQISINDDFFSLGGNSIHFINVLAKIRKLGYTLTFQEMYKYPTIKQLVNYVFADANKICNNQETLVDAFSLLNEEDRIKIPYDLEDAYPLSMLQAGLVYLSELSFDTPIYHDIVSYIIEGSWDEELFKKAVYILVENNPIFRTSYHLTGYSEYLQFVHKNIELPLEIEDLTTKCEPDQLVWFKEFMVKERARRFRWEQPELIKIYINKLSEKKYRYILSYHNSAIDGWSISLIHTSLFKIYYTLLEGKEFKFSKVDNHLRNYIRLEKQELENIESKEYWKAILTDYPFTKIARWCDTKKDQKIEVSIIEVPLPEGLSDEIIRLASDLKVPIKNILLAAHMFMLSRITGSKKVNTGYEQSGRPEVENADQSIGVFLNTVPFKMNLSGGTWEELIHQVYQLEIQLLPHRRYPMAKMKQDLQIQKNLFETAFNYTHFTNMMQLSQLSEFEMQSDLGEAVTEFILRTEVGRDYITGDVIVGFHYHKNCITDKQMEYIGNYYVEILKQMTLNKKEQYNNAICISQEETSILCQTGIGEVAPINSDDTIYDLFIKQALKTPHAIAISEQEISYTYKQLEQKVNEIAQLLSIIGIKPGVQVVDMAGKAINKIMIALGVWQIGATYIETIQVDSDKVYEMLNISQCDIVCIDNNTTIGMEDFSLPYLNIEMQENTELLLDSQWKTRQKYKNEFPYKKIQWDDTYKYFHIIKLKHDAMVNQCKDKIHALNMNQEDIVYFEESIKNNISIWKRFAPLMVGAHVKIGENNLKNNLNEYPQFLVEQSVTIFEIDNQELFDLVVYLETSEINIKTALKIVLVSSKNYDINIMKRWFECVHSKLLFTIYSEELGRYILEVLISEIPKDETRLLVRPTLNTNVCLVNEDNTPVPVEVIGEICVSGVGITESNLTSEQNALINSLYSDYTTSKTGYFKTGLMGRVLYNGGIEFLGKKEEQVSVKDRSIEADKVEKALSELKEIEKAIVITKQDENTNTELVVFLKFHRKIHLNKIQDYLLTKLDHFSIPKYYIELDHIPLTSTGKIDKKVLFEIMKRGDFLKEKYEITESKVEEKLITIWAETLGISKEEVNLSENFFMAGGNSLSAINLVLKSDGLINLVDLMKNFTLGNLIYRCLHNEDTNTVVGDELLIKLNMNDDTLEEKLTLICFPYGGGNAINFKDLSNSLSECNSKIDVYGVELPGHNLSKLDESTTNISNIAQMCIQEIKSKINTPILIWGHCAGSAIALEVAKLLEQNKMDLRYVFIGGRIMRSKEELDIQIKGLEDIDDQEIKEWLFDEIGFRDLGKLNNKQEQFIINSFKHDAYSASKYLRESYESTVKIDVPIINIVTRDDEMTEGYQTEYIRWQIFSDEVLLKEITSGGHYFINTRVNEVTNIIMDVISFEK